jgi:hypothetical protein
MNLHVPNYRPALDCSIPCGLRFEHHLLAASEAGRWPAMRTSLAIIALIGLFGCVTSSTVPSSDVLKAEISGAPLTVKFVNNGDEPIRILKPLDGSESCWIMPYYKLTVTDEGGKEIPRSARCGMYGYPYSNTKWPDDYLVTIPAQGSYSLPLRPNHDIPVTGSYTLCFHYIFKPDTKWTPGGRYPRNLWRGEVTSNTIEARLETVQRE